MLINPPDTARSRTERPKVLVTRPLSLRARALPEDERGFVVVRPGDSLSSIAARVLGAASRWREIWDLNRDFVPNPRLVFPGQTLRLPPDATEPRSPEPQEAEPSAVAEPDPDTPARTYVVRAMDSLTWIAKRELGDGGRWREIWLANRDRLPSPNLLYPGMVLKLPRTEAPTDHGGPSTEPSPDPVPEPGSGTGLDTAELSPAERVALTVYETQGDTIAAQAAALDLEPSVAAAVLITESSGAGFGRDGRLKICFERHIFASRTGAWVANTHRNQAEEYRALEEAKGIDPVAAYASISMGVAQIMGFNARSIGYADAEAMFEDMGGSEERQVDGFFAFVAARPALLEAARTRNWAAFARGYNGPAYSRNRYDIKMATYDAAYTRILALSRIEAGT
jgi:LysM repeat protein